MIGLGLTFVGTVLAALKGVLTNMFMVGDLKLHPLVSIYPHPLHTP